MEAIFDEITNENISLYFLGFSMFVCTIIDHVINPQRKIKPFLFYVQEAIYTTIMITCGIAIGAHLEVDVNINKIIAIVMGIVGPTLIRKIKHEKDTVADSMFDVLLKFTSASKNIKTKTKTNGNIKT